MYVINNLGAIYFRLTYWVSSWLWFYDFQVGNSIYVAGQIAMIPTSLQLVPDIRAQSRLSLRHVSRVLAAMHAGIDISSVVLAICYVTHHEYIQHARKELQHALRECQVSCTISPSVSRVYNSLDRRKLEKYLMMYSQPIHPIQNRLTILVISL